MSKNEQKLIEYYRAMTSENKMGLLSLSYVTKAAQENAMQAICRQYGLSPEGYPAQAQAG